MAAYAAMFLLPNSFSYHFLAYFVNSIDFSFKTGEVCGTAFDLLVLPISAETGFSTRVSVMWPVPLVIAFKQSLG